MSDKKTNTSKKLLSVSWIGLVAIILWLVYGLILKLCPSETQFLNNSFEPLNTLFSGLAMAAIIVSIFYQSKEMDMQWEDLQLQRKELENTRKVFETQNFETTFFNLIENRSKLIEHLEYRSIKNEFGDAKTGREAIPLIIEDIKYFLRHLLLSKSQKTISIYNFYLCNPTALKNVLHPYKNIYDQFLFIINFIDSKKLKGFFDDDAVNTYYDILINSLTLKEKKIISFFVFIDFKENSKIYQRLDPLTNFPLLDKISGFFLPPLVSFTPINGSYDNMGTLHSLGVFFQNKKFVIKSQDSRTLIIGNIILSFEDEQGKTHRIILNESETKLSKGEHISIEFTTLQDGSLNTLFKAFGKRRSIKVSISAKITAEKDQSFQLETSFVFSK